MNGLVNNANRLKIEVTKAINHAATYAKRGLGYSPAADTLMDLVAAMTDEIRPWTRADSIAVLPATVTLAEGEVQAVTVTATWPDAGTQIVMAPDTATLTYNTAPSNTNTVTIGDRVYTYKTALTETKATGTLTATTIADTNTVTIGTKVYTFQDSLTNVDGNVKIGATLTDTLTNLKNAINLGAGTVGTDYATLMTAHPTVEATASNGTTVSLRAETAGTAGNAIATTDTLTDGAFGAVTLTGGVAAVANEILIGVSTTTAAANLRSALNGTSGAGTTYSTGTVAHADVFGQNSTNVLSVFTRTHMESPPALAKSGTHPTLSAAVMSGGVYDTRVTVASSAAGDGVMSADGRMTWVSSGESTATVSFHGRTDTLVATLS